MLPDLNFSGKMVFKLFDMQFFPMQSSEFLEMTQRYKARLLGQFDACLASSRSLLGLEAYSLAAPVMFIDNGWL